ncbi:hypothetical protein QJS10_CPA01g00918 [Acorus calamus]|uniref:DUF4220 domain-containing protein n=1 Tax=Acorus calamus TaxID=4465 RepID=A0AAV9FQJ1_ACOCL|nr:hypothetical protein QJS10_CPA01g00918 [Acorus calamus]
MRGWRLGLVIWFAYLVADYVATTALGVLSGSTAIGGGGGNGDDSYSEVTTPPTPPSSSSSDGLHNVQTELVAFWSSFLLLHLGGPDTITAFALEDNELWKRHLLGLISQVGLALYVITKSVIMKSGRWNQLLVPTVLMFLVGVLKFGERTWTLRYGSQDKLRESMANESDTEMEESEDEVETANNTTSNTTCIVDIDIEVEDEAHVEAVNNTTNSTISTIVDESMILPKAHELYHTFRRLIVDQILSSHDRDKSKPFFMKLTAKQAFRVIEIELSLLYETLYTKAPLVYTVPGVCFRALAFTFITISFFFQFITNKSRYCEIGLSITYVLLVGALALELYANALHICSDQAFLWLKQRRKFNNNRWLLRLFSRKEKRYWSHSMAQYNLADDCLYKPHYIKKKIIQWIDLMEEFQRTRNIPVSEELKEFIFKELNRKLMEKEKAVDSSSSSKWKLDSSRDYRRLSDCWGEKVLQDCGCLDKLGWSVVDVEFDESILIWHAVTDMCYNIEENCSLPNEAQISKSLSDYMLYLLVFHTPMITAGIRKPYKALFGSLVEESQNNAAWKQLKSTTFLGTYKGAPTLGRVGKSVLSNLERLAGELDKMDRTENWKMVSAVWRKMLCYAASHCRGYNHAQRLSKGGELLTFVWFLMVHLGVGQHYRKEVGHAIIQIQA